MKKALLITFGVLFSLSLVNAETYYTNDKNVEFSKDEYDFISNMYYEGYQNYMNQSDLDKIRELDLVNQPIEKVSTPDTMPILNSYEKGRYFYLDKACNTECLVVLTAKWTGTPTVASYDVIGARFDGVTTTSIGAAVVTGDNLDGNYITPKKASNGFGYSVKIASVRNLMVTTSFYAKPSGRVYATYQHAMNTITEANSKNYTFNIKK